MFRRLTTENLTQVHEFSAVKTARDRHKTHRGSRFVVQSLLCVTLVSWRRRDEPTRLPQCIPPKDQSRDPPPIHGTNDGVPLYDGRLRPPLGLVESDMPELYHADRALVRRMIAGEEAAFGDFFDATASRLYRFALTRLNHDADAAEEVAQATLCAAIRKVSTYRGEAALFTWLCTFCRHEISAHYSRRGARETPLTMDAPEVRAALDSLGACDDGPHERFRRQELASLVRGTLDALPGRYGDAWSGSTSRGCRSTRSRRVWRSGPRRRNRC
jgi:RNA polymerase sigma factor (sigma-70 family)